MTNNIKNSAECKFEITQRPALIQTSTEPADLFFLSL